MDDENYDDGAQQEELFEDDSTDPNFVPPKDGSWVPRKVMNERMASATSKIEQQLQAEREARIRLEEQVKHLAAAPERREEQKPAPTVYSLAQLRTFVEDGKISQEQADQIFEQQIEQKFETKLATAMSQQATSHSATVTVENGLNAYLELMPDLLTEGTENRNKVRAEYNKLVSIMGAKKPDSLDDKKLQLVALQNAFGDVNTLREKRKGIKNTAQERETHQESGGAVDETLSEGDNKIVKGLTKARRDYYRKMIDKGFYKGWKEVGEELKYARR